MQSPVTFTFSEIFGDRKRYVEESIFDRLRWSILIWWRLHTECQHDRTEQRKWLEGDTPMAETWCLDCDFHDYGHVHADPKTWLG